MEGGRYAPFRFVYASVWFVTMTSTSCHATYGGDKTAHVEIMGEDGRDGWVRWGGTEGIVGVRWDRMVRRWWMCDLGGWGGGRCCQH